MIRKDLQDLEEAARIIVAVIERSHVSDEVAEERRNLFQFISEEKERQKNDRDIEARV